MRRPSLAFASVLVLATAACTVGPDYKPTAAATPAQWAEAKSGGAIETGPEADRQLLQWWAEFHDPELDSLVRRAVAGNLNLQIATQRIIEARAERRSTAGDLYPHLSAGGMASRARISNNLISLPGAGEASAGGASAASATSAAAAEAAESSSSSSFGGVSNSFVLGFDASWELDIFGKTRRAVEARDAQVQEAVERRHDALVTLLSDVATSYAALRSAQERLDIAQHNLKAEQDILDLTGARFRSGLTAEVDVAQARAQLASLRSTIPELQNTIGENIHALAILIGANPGDLETELLKPGALPPVPPVLPAALPGDVVRNRPDIREAERAVVAANAQIGVAIANKYPAFKISPDLGLLSNKVDKLFKNDSLSWVIGPSVSLPIFQGGKLDAAEDLAKAETAEARLSYRQTVLGAFRDVEDALLNYQTAGLRQQALREEVQASQIAFQRSSERYRSGLSDFTTVLNTEQSVLSSQDNLAQADFAVLRSTVALYKALGAGWQALDTDPEKAPAVPGAPQGASADLVPTGAPVPVANDAVANDAVAKDAAAKDAAKE